MPPTELVEISEQDQQALTQSEQYLKRCQQLQIVDQPSYDQAADELKSIKGHFKEIEARRVALVKPLNDHVKNINDWFKKPLKFYEDAEAFIKRAIVKYSTEQEEIRQKEQRRLQAEAELKEQERQRELKEEAEKLRAAGAVEAAQATEYAATVVSAPPVADATFRRAEGVHTVKTWTFEVVDFSKVPDQYKLANEKLLREAAVGGSGAYEIPGVRFFTVTTISARS